MADVHFQQQQQNNNEAVKRQQAAYYGQDVDEDDEFMGDEEVDLVVGNYGQQGDFVDEAQNGEF